MSPPLKRIFLWLGATLLGLLVLAILLISPIAEYVIEKNSKENTGRVIYMDDLSINLLTGSVSISGLHILEQDDKSDFISCELFQTSIKYLPVFKGEYVLPGTLIQGLNINI